jgi:hypothetical protein
MKTPIRYVAPLFAAAAISGTIALAPAAAAAPSTNRAPSSSNHVVPPAPATYELGVDPLVPTDTGADPFVFIPPGYGLPF